MRLLTTGLPSLRHFTRDPSPSPPTSPSPFGSLRVDDDSVGDSPPDPSPRDLSRPRHPGSQVLTYSDLRVSSKDENPCPLPLTSSLPTSVLTIRSRVPSAPAPIPHCPPAAPSCSFLVSRPPPCRPREGPLLLSVTLRVVSRETSSLHLGGYIRTLLPGPPLIPTPDVSGLPNSVEDPLSPLDSSLLGP